MQVRGRAGPVFASIFLPTLKNAEPPGRSGRLLQLENREFSLGSLVGDIGKQWQQGVLLNSTMELNDALATLKSSQHFGEHQMMEKRIIYYCFRLVRWNTLSFSDSMATGSFSGLHGNPLLRAWQHVPLSVSPSFAVGFGAGDAAREL